jgi:delta 1-pyrroline-5-carboxylate dehydrogenase
MKKITCYIVGIAVGIVAGWTGNNMYHAKSKAKTEAYIAKLEQEADVRELALTEIRARSEEEIAMLRGMIDSAATLIAGYDEEINGLHDQADSQSAVIDELLTAEVQELIERYPALKTYTLAFKAQVDTKDKIISNLEARDAERVVVIGALEKQIQLEREIGLSWKKQFEDQRALRIAEKSDFDHYRRETKLSVPLAIAGGAAAGLLGAVVFH